MRNYPNIEKSVFRRGDYVGYGGGAVWNISRPHKKAQWRAVPIQWVAQTNLQPFCRDKLEQVSNYLAAF